MALKSQDEKEVEEERLRYRQDKQFLLQCVLDTNALHWRWF